MDNKHEGNYFSFALSKTCRNVKNNLWLSNNYVEHVRLSEFNISRNSENNNGCFNKIFNSIQIYFIENVLPCASIEVASNKQLKIYLWENERKVIINLHKTFSYGPSGHNNQTEKKTITVCWGTALWLRATANRVSYIQNENSFLMKNKHSMFHIKFKFEQISNKVCALPATCQALTLTNRAIAMCFIVFHEVFRFINDWRIICDSYRNLLGYLYCCQLE